MFPNLVIYHEFRDFGHGLRDKILLSWQVTSPWFLEIPRKMGKTHYFSQKYQNFSHFFKKIRDFSAILRFIARDYSDFLVVFLLVIFVTFLPWSRDFQEKSFGNTVVSRGARGAAAPLHFEGNKGRTFDLLSFKNFKKWKIFFAPLHSKS